jgi:hypothetical protein
VSPQEGGQTSLLASVMLILSECCRAYCHTAFMVPTGVLWFPSMDFSTYGTHKEGQYSYGKCNRCEQEGARFNKRCIPCNLKEKHNGCRYVAPGATCVFRGETARVKKDRNPGIFAHGPIFPTHHHTSWCRNSGIEYIALTGRALAAVDPPEPKEVKQFVNWVKSNIEVLLPGLKRDIVSWSDERFIETGHFPKSTKVANYRASEWLKRTPRNYRDAKKKAVFKAFLKHEKSDKPGVMGPDLHGRPRLIQGCSPEATVATGRWIKAFQEQIHHVLKGPMLFSAGCNAEDLSAWFAKHNEGKERWFEDDFTLYDSTFSLYCHDLVIWLYERCGMRKDPWAWILRNQQARAKGYSQYGWQYYVDGTMRSGVADTCLANSLINYFAHLYCIVRLNPLLTIQQILERVAMAVMGDDIIMMTTASVTVEGSTEILRRLGFRSKLKQRDSPEQLIYLNMRPYPVKGGLRFAPLVGRLLARLGYAVQEQKDWQAYSRGVYEAFLASCAHVPVLAQYVRRMVESRSGGRPLKYDIRRYQKLERQFEYNCFSLQAAEATPETDAFICRTYDISLQHLRQAIEEVQRLPPAGIVFSPVLEAFFDKDL